MKAEALAELLRFLRESDPAAQRDGLSLSAAERRALAEALAKLAGPAPASAPSRRKAAARAVKRGQPPAGARALLHCDGASRGNPGPAAFGFVVSLEGDEIYSRGEALGTLSNNQAEYRALLAGLAAVHELGFARVDIALDSELIVRQIQGRYKVKNEGLKPLYAQALAALARFEDWNIRHVPRAENAAADALANEALDSL